MVAVHSSETFMNICRNAQRYIPGDSTLKQKLCMLIEIKGVPCRGFLRIADAFRLLITFQMPLVMTPYFRRRIFCLSDSQVIVRAGAELRLFNLGHGWGTVLQAGRSRV
jgi:hypothetical protein